MPISLGVWSGGINDVVALQCLHMSLTEYINDDECLSAPVFWV